MHAFPSSLLLACAVLLFASVAVAEQTVRTVALSGQSAPSSIGGQFGNFSGLSLNDRGQVAFAGTVRETMHPTDGFIGSGFWLAGPNGSLSNVIVSDDPIPEAGASARFGRVRSGGGAQPPGAGLGNGSRNSLMLNDFGDVVIRGSFSWPNGAADEDPLATGVLRWSHRSGVSPVVQIGRALPGENGEMVTLRAIDRIAIDENGAVNVIGLLVDAFEGGIWRAASGSTIEPRFVPGSFAGNDPPVEIDIVRTLEIARPRFTDKGGFVAAAGQPFGVWAERDGVAPQLIATSASPAPVAGLNGEFFTGFFSPTISNNGDIAFLSTFSLDPGGGPLRNHALFVDQGQGALEIVARVDDRIDSDTKSYRLASLIRPGLQSISAADDGQLVVNAHIDPLDNPAEQELQTILVQSADGQLKPLAIEGDPTPRLPGRQFESFEDVRISGSGQVVFTAVTARGGGSHDSLWAQDPNGDLQLVAHVGGVLDVNDNPDIQDERTISAMTFRGLNGSPDLFDINDAGEVAFMVSFTDGTSGVFVSRVAAIPEPGT
ncbi:MAG: choice-of-anchor tandem repeat NxxGxxAF-containing protein, partial [Planctomycetota bacterium]